MNSSANLKVDIEEAVRPADDEVEVKDENGNAVGDIDHVSKLKYAPEQFLSGDEKRPLQYTDSTGHTYTYVLKPTMYCVLMILLLEACERFAYYGISFTLNNFLIGFYNHDWSPDFTPPQAATYVGTGTSVAYAFPVVGAILADGFFGTFRTTAVSTLLIYIPGLFLIALSAKPDLFSEFSLTMFSVAYYGMYAVGAGVIKSCVNILGANQYHPVVHKHQIATYYVRFYTFINIGALLGGLTVPLNLAKDSGSMQFYMYLCPPIVLCVGYIIFVAGSRRYVKTVPAGSVILQSFMAGCSALTSCSLKKQTVEHGGKYSATFIENLRSMGHVIVLMALTLPFSIIYSQMTGIFMSQGAVMKNAGLINSGFLNNFDAISVLIAGFVVGNLLYPFLEKRGINLNMMTKFAFGNLLSVISVLLGIWIDHHMKSTYQESLNDPTKDAQISILWMALPYALIGFGEIFVYSTSYAIAFGASPDGFKAMGSAINLLFIGCFSNLINTALINACTDMLTDPTDRKADIDTMEKYSRTRFNDFYWIIAGVGLFGAVICFLPWTRKYYNYVEQRTLDLQKMN